MNIQQAISKAIDGGYQGDKDFILNLPEYALCQIWLDPAFWQALGKAMGWPEMDDIVFDNSLETFHVRMEGWRHRWHRFIDHLADGKTIKSFFKPL